MARKNLNEKEKKIKAEALAILNQILEEIKSQSRRGLSYLVVMPLYKNKDYLGSDFEEISHRRKKSRLTGKGKIVFDECKKAGLDPKIDYCSNRDPRFRIIISW